MIGDEVKPSKMKKKKKVSSMADLKAVAKDSAAAVAEPDMDDYKVKNAADTILQAHEHMADPELMKKVQPHLDKKKKAIESIADLRARAKELGAY